MMMMQCDKHAIYLHQAMNYKRDMQYVVIYGLEVTVCLDRAEAIRKFAQCVDHAEECAGNSRPIFGGDYEK